MKTILRKTALAAVIVASISPAALAQGIPVFDASSFGQLVASLQQGAQQLAQLQSQLTAQLAAIQSLPSGYLSGLSPLINSTTNLIGQIQNIQQQGNSLLSTIQSVYPTNYSGTSPLQLLNDLQSMEAANREATYQAQDIQNQIAQVAPQLTQSVSTAEGSSATAAGPTEAIQSTNQILGVLSTQLTQQDTILTVSEKAQEAQMLQDQSQEAAGDQYLAPVSQPTGSGF